MSLVWEDLWRKLGRERKDRGAAPAAYAAADVVRKSVRAGRVELPILNLAGLWALREMDRGDGDDAAALLKILWVLRHQEEDRILRVEAEPPSAQELAALGREVDLASLGDYVSALDVMFALLTKKKAEAATRD